MKKAQGALGKAVVFNAGKSTWAAELKLIREVVKCRSLSPLPNASPKIAGIINVRGEIIPVLSRWWCGRDTGWREGHSASIILLKSGQETIGLDVDNILGIEDIHAYDLGDIPVGDGQTRDTAVSCSVHVAETGSIPLLDIKLILESLKSENRPANSIK